MNPRLRARFERRREEAVRLTREQKDELAEIVAGGRVLFDEPLKNHSSIGIGGPAEVFVVIENIDGLKNVVQWALERNVEYRFWGGGSNVLVRDGGLNGLVIKLGESFNSVAIDRVIDDDVYVTASAATPTKKLVSFCIENSLAGMSALAGIWGTVGGNLMTNAGTHKGAIGDFVEELTIVDKNCRELTMKKGALNFSYRSLRLPKTAAIVRALFKFKRAEKGAAIKEVNEILERRKTSQPVDVKSLGCIFKNPGKSFAGMLVEDAGLKGVRVGQARVSQIHGNFIVNEGNATARDVVVLINLIRERVKEQTGIVLETEIEITGKE